MGLLQEFESSQVIDKSTNIGITSEHPLHGKTDSIKVLELSTQELFRSRLLIIENVGGGKAGILVYSDESVPPDRKSTSLDGTPLSFKVFGETSTMGSIVSLSDQSVSASRAEGLALLQATNMKLACEVSGVKNDRDITLSGMSTVIIPTAEVPDPMTDENIRAAIAFLFGKEGPLSDSVILPESGQDQLMGEIVANGGIVVGRSTDLDLNLTFAQLSDINDSLLRMVEERGLVSTSDVDPASVVKAFLANIPLLTGLYDRLRHDGETYDLKSHFDFVKHLLEVKFTKLLKPELVAV